MVDSHLCSDPNKRAPRPSAAGELLQSKWALGAAPPKRSSPQRSTSQQIDSAADAAALRGRRFLAATMVSLSAMLRMMASMPDYPAWEGEEEG